MNKHFGKLKNDIKIVFFTLTFLGITIMLMRDMWLNTLPRMYTIGKTIKIYKPAKGSIAVEYAYQINNKSYSNSISFDNYWDEVKTRKKYMVEIPIDYPDEGKLLLNYPVPDTVSAPAQGWKSIPNFIINYADIKFLEDRGYF